MKDSKISFELESFSNKNCRNSEEHRGSLQEASHPKATENVQTHTEQTTYLGWIHLPKKHEMVSQLSYQMMYRKTRL